MDKYYTPEIEEFHIGFEYEFQTLKGWEKRKLNEVYHGYYCTLSEVDEGLKEGNIRVKYLDKSDIEDLGFETMGSGWYKNSLKLDLAEIPHWTNIALRTWHDSSLFIEGYRGEINSENEDCGKLFDGVIKNKSELIKLLIQLRIITTFVSDEAKH